MAEHAHGDARRPDGDLVSGMKPIDRRTDPEPEESGPKVGYGSDAVYLPHGTDDTSEDGVADEPSSED